MKNQKQNGGSPDHAAFHEPGHLHPLQDPQWETHQALQLHESTRHRDMAVSNKRSHWSNGQDANHPDH